MLSVNNIKTAVIYTAMIVVMFCIPSYFAIKSAIMEEKLRTVYEMIEWTAANENKIFQESGLHIPNSLRFKINIYNDRKKPIYESIKEFSMEPNFKIYSKYPNIYYQKEAIYDKELYYYVVEATLNYDKIVFVATILLFTIPCIIFLMSNLFINSSVYPYKRVQKYMDDFFNDSMHELKTPLGVINSNLELISKNAQNSKHIQRMRSAAKQMWMTYEDIEYYIKHKAITYDKEIVNFSEYLKFRIEFFQDIALPKSITVESAVEPDIFMNINKTQLQRLIDNNISNAIKYSFYKGKIKIILKKTKNGFAIFSVCDQGIGIENVKNIFKRFKREDNTQGGFGLGLSIVQNICDQNKIKIYVKSPKGRGSIFKYAFKTPTI